MENTNITKKYTQIGKGLLVIAVLFAISPAMVFAENEPIDASYENYGNPIDASYENYGNPIDVSYENYGNPIDVSSGGTINSNSTPSSVRVTSGGVSGGASNVTPSNFTPVSASTPSSGGFSGGFSSVTSSNFPSASVSTPSSGGFSGGASSVTPSNFTQVSASTPSSGGVSGGSSNVTPFNFPLVSTQPVVSGGTQNIPLLSPTYFPNNQVLALNDTPNLSSVYLSDVPYTGAGDTIKVILFTLSLILWSIVLTYAILKRKENEQEAFAMVANVQDGQNSSFYMPSQIASDEQALKDIENYARENKILFSTSASTKLLKLERLNQINANDIISKIAKEDWVCVGEADLERYL